MFPVDYGSAVYHFEARMGDITIVAECQERQAAQETCTGERSGANAILMEESSASVDIFHCALGILPSNTDAVIEFRYVQDISLELNGGAESILPTVLTPPYIPGNAPVFTVEADSIFDQ